ncbi:MAG: hypothetical protein BWY38_03057 [Ignavibacteria bacterium ADurb.Bin266]|nr:MAG: hypothetical protein BWY38_03057 [Ignavibacteria bacterium ADurb.Bin266]
MNGINEKAPAATRADSKETLQFTNSSCLDITKKSNICQEQKTDWLKAYFINQKPSLHLHYTVIQSESEFDIILKARRICREHPEFTVKFFPATADNPERIENAYKSIHNKADAIDFLLKAEEAGII